MPRLLTADDLRPVHRTAMEAAYQDSKLRRPRCSHEDFYAGWVAGLERFGFYEAFEAAAWKETHQSVGVQ